MKYHAPTGGMVITVDALKGATLNLRWALKKIREASKLPLDRYPKEPGRLTDADMAQMAVIEAAEQIGIDLGVTRHDFHKLDLRDAG